MPTDQILATEEMVGAGHATKSDTLNRFLNKITTAGDILYGTASATAARLGIGTAGQVLKVNSGANAPEWASAQDAKAWVNFNGTGTVAIRASYNVTSITDNGVGDYTVNLTNEMVDVNYAVIATSSSETNTSLNGITSYESGTARTTSLFRIYATCFSGTQPAVQDPPHVQVAVFR